jgi:DNA anti-recombination protein RmuC
MFVPIEAMLSTLFARDHELLEFARTSRVLIASPITLMLYLEAFSRGWAAQKQSENATLILEEARILVNRLTIFAEKFGKVGTMRLPRASTDASRPKRARSWPCAAIRKRLRKWSSN